MGIALRIIGCGEESELIARPSEFAVLVIVASLLIEVVQKGKFCLVISDEICLIRRASEILGVRNGGADGTYVLKEFGNPNHGVCFLYGFLSNVSRWSEVAPKHGDDSLVTTVGVGLVGSRGGRKRGGG